MIIATGGALTFTLTVEGAATHGSTRYEGVSALDVFLPVYQALQDLERERNADVVAADGRVPDRVPADGGTGRRG